MAHGDVAVIAAKHHLFALGDDMALAVDAGVDGGLGTAVANGFDLLDGICHLHQPLAAGEQAAQKVGAQAKAYHRDIIIVYDGTKLVDLLPGQELAFVGNDHIAIAVLGLLVEGVYIRFRRDDLHLGLQTDTAAQDPGTVPNVGAGLDEPYMQVVFLVIIFGDQRLSGFAGAHCAVFEVKLGHWHSPPL